MSSDEIELLRASKHGDVDSIRRLLVKGINVNYQNVNGLSALHLAAKEGRAEAAEVLIEGGANVDSVSTKGNTSLHIASLCGQESVVDLLLKSSANVNIQSLQGFTALYMACQENHLSIVLKLLRQGADPSLSTLDGFAPMDVAKQLGYDPIIQLLESQGAVRAHSPLTRLQGHSRHTSTLGANSLPRLHAAAKRDDVDCIEKILTEGLPIDGQTRSGFTALHISCHYGKTKAARFLIERGADVNFSKARNSITPLHVAAKWGFRELIVLLLEQRADIESRTKDGLTPLHCAARFGKDAVIETLLDRGAQIDPKSQNGLTPLHMSVQGDFEECVRLLLNRGAYIEAATVDHLTPLHVAAHCGHVRCAEVLLRNNCNAKAEALNGFTPLHIACKKNRIQVVELLLGYYGNNVNIKTKAGLSPLHIAAFMGHVDLLELLTSKGAEINSSTIQQETPLHLAIRADQFDCAHYLVDHGADIGALTKNGYTPLHLAAQLGNQRVVSFLLKRGASPDCRTLNDLAPLHLAAKEGYATIVDELLTNGADKELVSKRGLTPLHFASKYGNYEVVHLLLKHGSNVMVSDKNGLTPLHHAVQGGHHNVARVLLEHGSDSHSIAKNGFTPLHVAALYNRYHSAKMMLEKYEANPLAKSLNGYTPVHIASKEGYHDLLALLLASLSPGDGEALVDVRSSDGVHPLHLAAQENHIPVLQLLLKNSATPDPTNKELFTPLHLSSYHGNLDAVKILLEHGADPNKANKNGFTPLHLAAQEGNSVVVTCLLDNQADPNLVNQTDHTAFHLAHAHGFRNVVKLLEPVTQVQKVPTGDVARVAPGQIFGEEAIVDSEDEIESEKVKTSDFASLPEDAQNFSYVANQEAGQRDSVFGGRAVLGDRSISRELRYLNDEAEFSVVSLLMSQREGEEGKTMERSGDSGSLGFRYRHLHPPRYMDSRASSINTSHSALISEASGSHYNLDLADSPIQSGFLVSFVVDARGKAMCGMRHTGVRIIVSPGKTSGPVRVTCKLVNPGKMTNPPPLIEGEGLASRILKMGPAGTIFEGPVVIEVPHFASLQDRQREVIILRSEDGEVWKEHVNKFPLSEVHNIIKNSFGEELSSAEELYQQRVARIITCDFPKYFALVSTPAHDRRVIGPSGGEMTSSIDPRVVVGIPNNAFNKKIHIRLQVQKIPDNLKQKMEENGVYVSPVVTVEPRRRKFHQPVTIRIPIPQTGSKKPGKMCLLCSLSEGQDVSVWEDITDKSSLKGENECIYFHTSVSGRFWLVNTADPAITPAYCGKAYEEMCRVPYFSKFVLFARRSGVNKGILRLICSAEGKLQKTLEGREQYKELGQTNETEVVSGNKYSISFKGNLEPYQKLDKGPLDIIFEPFKESRLSTGVFIKNLNAQPSSEIDIFQEATSFDEMRKISSLEFVLPELEEDAMHSEDQADAQSPDHFEHLDRHPSVHYDLTQLGCLLGRDWVKLADAFGINDEDVNSIKQRSETPEQEAQDFLKQLLSEVKDTEMIAKGLDHIRRPDAVMLWLRMNEEQELRTYMRKYLPGEIFDDYTWTKETENSYSGCKEQMLDDVVTKHIVKVPLNVKNKDLETSTKEVQFRQHKNDGTHLSKCIKKTMLRPKGFPTYQETRQEILAKEFQLTALPSHFIDESAGEKREIKANGDLTLTRIFKKSPGAKKSEADIIEEIVETVAEVNDENVEDLVIEAMEERLDKIKLDDGMRGSKLIKKIFIKPKTIKGQRDASEIGKHDTNVQEKPEELLLLQKFLSGVLPYVDLKQFHVVPGQPIVLRKKVVSSGDLSESWDEIIELAPGVENVNQDNVEIIIRTREFKECLPDGKVVTRILKKTVVTSKELTNRKETPQENVAREFQFLNLPSFELDKIKGEIKETNNNGALVVTRYFKKSPVAERGEVDVVEEVIEIAPGTDEINMNDVVVESFEARLDDVQLYDGRRGSKVIKKTVITPKIIFAKRGPPGKSDRTSQERPEEHLLLLKNYISGILPNDDLEQFQMEVKPGQPVILRKITSPRKPSKLIEEIIELAPGIDKLNQDNVEITTKIREFKEHLPDGRVMIRILRKTVVTPKEEIVGKRKPHEILAKEFQMINLPSFELDKKKGEAKKTNKNGAMELTRYFKKDPTTEKGEADVVEEVIEIADGTDEINMNDVVVDSFQARLEDVKLYDGRQGSQIVKKTIITPRAITAKISKFQIKEKESVVSEEVEELLRPKSYISQILPNLDLTLFKTTSAKPGQPVILRKKTTTPEKPSESLEETIELAPGVDQMQQDNVEISTSTREFKEYLPDGQYVTRILKKTIVKPKGLPAPKEPRQEILFKEFQIPELPSFRLDERRGESKVKNLDGSFVVTRIFKKSKGAQKDEADVVEEVIETASGIDETNVDDVVVETFETRVDNVILDDGRKGSKVIRRTVVRPKAVVVPEPAEKFVGPQVVIEEVERKFDAKVRPETNVQDRFDESSFLPQTPRSREVIVMTHEHLNIDGNVLLAPRAKDFPNIESFLEALSSDSSGFSFPAESSRTDTPYVHLVPSHLRYCYEFPLPETPQIENFKETVSGTKAFRATIDIRNYDADFHFESESIVLESSKVTSDHSSQEDGDFYDSCVEISHVHYGETIDSSESSDAQKGSSELDQKHAASVTISEGGVITTEYQTSYEDYSSKVAPEHKDSDEWKLHLSSTDSGQQTSSTVITEGRMSTEEYHFPAEDFPTGVISKQRGSDEQKIYTTSKVTSQGHSVPKGYGESQEFETGRMSKKEYQLPQEDFSTMVVSERKDSDKQKLQTSSTTISQIAQKESSDSDQQFTTSASITESGLNREEYQLPYGGFSTTVVSELKGSDQHKLFTSSTVISQGDSAVISQASIDYEESEEFVTGEEWSLINDAIIAERRMKNRLAMERTVGPDGEIIERLITEEYLSDKSDSSSRRSSVDSASLTGKEIEKLDPLGLSGDIEKVDSEFKPLTVFTHTLEQDPVYETETTEYEDTLPDGTIVRRKVIKTNKKQTIIKRVILEGLGEEEPFSDLNSAAMVPHGSSNKQQITRYSDHSSADPEISTDVQAFEEQLEDGTVVRRRVTNTKQQQLTTERLVVSGTGLFECSKGGEEDVLESLKLLSLPAREED